MNFQLVLEWVKNNLFIVIFVVLMLASAITLPLIAAGMNQSVRKEVESRARKMSELTRLENAEINWLDQTAYRGVLNDRVVERFREISAIVAGDADQVYQAAIEHNRKGRGVIMPEALPEMPLAERERMPWRFHEALMASYRQLLSEINAHTPAKPEDIQKELEGIRNRFITQFLRKASEQELDDEDRNRLREHMATARMSLYAAAAENIGMYASIDQLDVPAVNPQVLPTNADLFNWQWKYWVTSDVLRALHEANRKEQSVQRAPVKHVLSLRVYGLPDASQAPTGSMGGFGGMQAAGSGDRSGSSGAPPAAPPNPVTPIEFDFSQSITGRRTTPLYDVLTVDLDLIVDVERLPEVLDAIAGYNFMTVTSLHLTEVDPFELARQGFVYGSAPVARVRMHIETIWLREWTRQFMPKAIKQALGVPVEEPQANTIDVS